MGARHDPSMVLRLIYLMFFKFLGWTVFASQTRDCQGDRDHSAAPPTCRAPTPNRPPRLGWADRALIAALTRLLPVHRRFGLLVTPSTILRWQRQLVARRWTTKPTRPGRPAIPGGCTPEFRSSVVLKVPEWGV
jgi:putative transposase